ncbi:hypothetical protein PBY51_000598 [Eleginops maclovinus]|uniref:Uncharacterized protein n=1 Tax=Eleginops maclovinus TaxID=56733 RepID=A0AAN7XPR3_ELEMC|nr:hypothetical protein PBY51_000598 [Eleginops maclovinus]
MTVETFQTRETVQIKRNLNVQSTSLHVPVVAAFL